MKVLAEVLAGLNVLNLLGGVALGVLFANPIKALLGKVLSKVGLVK